MQQRQYEAEISVAESTASRGPHRLLALAARQVAQHQAAVAGAHAALLHEQDDDAVRTAGGCMQAIKRSASHLLVYGLLRWCNAA